MSLFKVNTEHDQVNCHKPLCMLASLLIAAVITFSTPLTVQAETRVSTDARNDTGMGLAARTPDKGFLTTIAPRLVLKPSDSPRLTFCQLLPDGSRCPVRIANGRDEGAFPGIVDDFSPGLLPHVRVSVYVQSISNDAVSNGGVMIPVGSLKFINWETTGSSADVELVGPYGWSIPDPGQTYDQFGPHSSASGLRIYDALVYNTCGSFTSFPVKHHSWVTESGADIGGFNGSDNTTLDSTGYYNMKYSYQVMDSVGATSDITVEGKVSVICSGLASL